MKWLMATLVAALILPSLSYAAPAGRLGISPGDLGTAPQGRTHGIANLSAIAGFWLAQADDGTPETFSLENSVSGGTLTVLQGQVSNPIDLTVTSSNGFVVTVGGNSSTILPVTYSCTGLPLAAQCNFSPSLTTSVTTVTLTISTQGPTVAQRHSKSQGAILYAALLPGFFGILIIAGSRTARSRTRSAHALRVVGLTIAVAFCLLWLSSCAGSNGNPTSGTPRGSSGIVVNATTGGTNPITASTGFTLTVK